MNVDQTALIFVVEYFETLQTNRPKIACAYAEGARLVLFYRDKPMRQCVSNFQNVVPAGNRKVLQCNGELVANQLVVHVKSSLATPGGTDMLDEAFTCILTDSSILITYHSIHVNPFYAELPALPPPEPKPKPAAKPAPQKVEVPVKPPEEVADPSHLDPNLSVLVRNLPFKFPPSQFVGTLTEKFGRVAKFSQNSGKLAAQFETRKMRNEATHAAEFEWNGRVPRITGLPNGFKWEAPPQQQQQQQRKPQGKKQ